MLLDFYWHVEFYYFRNAEVEVQRWSRAIPENWATPWLRNCSSSRVDCVFMITAGRSVRTTLLDCVSVPRQL